MCGVPAVHSHTIKVEYTLICISKQIERQGDGPLALTTGEYLYQCRDCDAVWHAPSLYISVDESEVLGIYKQSLVWKPFHKTESHRTAKLAQYS